MTVPIDHHFIPAFFLAQWADGTGKLVEYTLKHGKLIAKAVGPRATGYEPHLYSFPELPRDAANFLETVFFDYPPTRKTGTTGRGRRSQPIDVLVVRRRGHCARLRGLRHACAGI